MAFRSSISGVGPNAGRRIWLRTRLGEGGRYLGIPQHEAFRRRQPNAVHPVLQGPVLDYAEQGVSRLNLFSLAFKCCLRGENLLGKVLRSVGVAHGDYLGTCGSPVTGPCPGVVTSLREGGDELLTFFRFPKAQWKALRSTNVIERLHEEFRRRVKTQGSLPTEDAALVLLFSLVASGQIKLRRIDGWQRIASVLSRHTAGASAAQLRGIAV